MRDNLVIFGPTASGKSSLALELAKRYDGELINMDSMQVYQTMDIATAKPSREEMAQVPHHLFDLVLPHEDFSSQDYKRMALRAISDIRSRGKNPILVGGTGLYLSSLYYDYDFRNKDDEKRNYYNSLLKEEGLERLQELAREGFSELVDKVDINNPHRLIRLLETGQVLEEKTRSSLPLKVFYLDWERELLNGRIERRIGAMIEAGLLEEVEYIFTHYGKMEYLPSIRGIGYKEYFSYLKGTRSLEEAKERHLISTRQYAKRQRTWARNQYSDLVYIDGRLDLEEKIKLIEENWR